MTANRFASASPWPVLLVALLLAGCGKADRSCLVKGQVSVNGRPAAGLYVMFHPVGKNQKQASPASARTDKDGTFSLRVPEPGEYAVTAFWPTVTVEQDETVEGEDSFRGRWRGPQRPASRATISERESSLPAIDLTFDFSNP